MAGGVPDGAGKVPEVDGLVICDEEGLAVDALVVEGDSGGGGGDEEELGGEEVRVGDVANVGEVEEVLVVADLDVVLAALVDVEDACEGLDVALTKDTGGADGASEELGVILAIRLEDELFSSSL